MGLTLNEICCLFCWPPCPPRKIHNKLWFFVLEPTYSIKNEDELQLTERAEWQYSEREKENIKVFYTRTKRGNKIACMHVKCSPNPRFTILFSQGNKVDLGLNSSFFLGLGSRINCNIFGYDYSGYGASGGKPSEKNLYADIEAAWNEMKTKLGIRPENIILFGQSFGCGPTVHLASKMKVGGVILQTPFMSAMSIICNTQTSGIFKFFDAFNNIDKIPRVSSPVLVIHGTEDEIVDFSHGQAIYEACTTAVEPLWVEGAGQTDLELYNQYLERLKTFVSSELTK